jgi:pyridoxal phosphate enzyme (YggS family)
MEGVGIQDKLAEVQRRIGEACARVGREPAEVELVAVSKTHGPEVVREAAACGLRVFGESRVQEAAAKIPECPGHLSWHFIGHLQTNKVNHAARFFDMVHSVDSARLLEALDGACERAGRFMPVCLEVNVSGEGSKYGVSPDELDAVIEVCRRCPRLEVAGLMTMPPFAEDPEKARPFFRQLRELKEHCARDLEYPVEGLSMGMSHDFEIAVEEGATWVRLGTVLFGPRGG